MHQCGCLAWAFGQAAHAGGRPFFAALCKSPPILSADTGFDAPVAAVARMVWGCACSGYHDRGFLARVAAWLQGGARFAVGDSGTFVVLAWSLMMLCVDLGAP